jgi:hypothetical protein
MEGDPDRAACENAYGPYTWTVKPEVPWEHAPEPDGSDDPPRNPLVIRLEARVPGVVRVCAANGICGEVVTQ